MTQFEFRLEELHLEATGSRNEQIVKRLNEFGRDGWHVRSIDLSGHPSFAEQPLAVLLEREVSSLGRSEPEPAIAGRHS